MCTGSDDMRPDCARAFGEISATQTSQGEILRRIDDNEKWMRRAVIGAALSVIVKVVLEWFRH